MNNPTSPSLTLHFIADNPSTQHNRDLFTWAHSVQDALRDWRQYYETQDAPSAGIVTIPTKDPIAGPLAWDDLHAETAS